MDQNHIHDLALEATKIVFSAHQKDYDLDKETPESVAMSLLEMYSEASKALKVVAPTNKSENPHNDIFSVREFWLLVIGAIVALLFGVLGVIIGLYAPSERNTENIQKSPPQEQVLRCNNHILHCP